MVQAANPRARRIPRTPWRLMFARDVELNSVLPTGGINDHEWIIDVRGKECIDEPIEIVLRLQSPNAEQVAVHLKSIKAVKIICNRRFGAIEVFLWKNHSLIGISHPFFIDV